VVDSGECGSGMAGTHFFLVFGYGSM